MRAHARTHTTQVFGNCVPNENNGTEQHGARTQSDRVHMARVGRARNTSCC
jgi:hypothetical protein